MSMEAMRELAGQVYPYWLVVIFVVFVAIAMWTYWTSKKRREQMRECADIPLKDDL